MKLISWNVNGLRACMQKGFAEFFTASDADIFCIQESKLQEGQIDFAPEGYYAYWNYAQKKGYSGTAIFTRKEPLSYRMEWEDAFLSYLKGLDRNKPLILCGDLNVAHEEIDLKNPKTNRKNAGFTDEERTKMTALLSAGFTDTFRHFYPDTEGIYSWWSYRFHAREKNAGWRIDYFITSSALDDRLVDAGILTDVTGSDHCPVTLTVDLPFCP